MRPEHRLTVGYVKLVPRPWFGLRFNSRAAAAPRGRL